MNKQLTILKSHITYTEYINDPSHEGYPQLDNDTLRYICQNADGQKLAMVLQKKGIIVFSRRQVGITLSGMMLSLDETTELLELYYEFKAIPLLSKKEIVAEVIDKYSLKDFNEYLKKYSKTSMNVVIRGSRYIGGESFYFLHDTNELDLSEGNIAITNENKDDYFFKSVECSFCNDAWANEIEGEFEEMDIKFLNHLYDHFTKDLIISR